MKVSLVEMMYKSNVIVLVTEAEKNKLVIWDDHSNKVRSEIAFDAGLKILNVKLSKDIMTVVFEDKSFIFDFVTLKFIEKIFTCKNSKGICAISQAEKSTHKIVCLPSDEKGCFKIINYGKYIFLKLHSKFQNTKFIIEIICFNRPFF